jgi:hypothetical protein
MGRDVSVYMYVYEKKEKSRRDADKYIIFSSLARGVIMLLETGLIYYVPSTLRKLSLGRSED